MSTAARELEELRKIREAQRLEKEEEQRIADEKAAKLAKKNEFLNRANAFQQKKGPTDEEVKETIHKASAQRKFGRELNKCLASEPGKNSIAMELALKAKHGAGGAVNDSAHNASGESAWELVLQENDRPYYWNRVTNETTYDKPEDMAGSSPPPPPPPPRRLPGMMPPAGQQPPPPQAPPQAPPQHVLPPPPVAAPPKPSPWTYVFENEPTPYYWNTETNETTFDRPASYVPPPAAPSAAAAVGESDMEGEGDEEAQVVMWQEVEDPSSGETAYVNFVTGESRTDQPAGTVVVVVLNEEGAEENWQVCVYEGQEDVPEAEFGALYYQNLSTGEVREERPEGGAVMIIEAAT